MMTAREMINMALDKFDGKLGETHVPGHSERMKLAWKRKKKREKERERRKKKNGG